MTVTPRELFIKRPRCLKNPISQAKDSDGNELHIVSVSLSHLYSMIYGHYVIVHLFPLKFSYALTAVVSMYAKKHKDLPMFEGLSVG